MMQQVKDHTDWVCRLRKSFYGLKQAPRAWFQKLSVSLKLFGFHNFNSNPYMFLWFKDNHTTIVLVYADALFSLVVTLHICSISFI